MFVPTFFCIGILVWLGLYEIRKWVELCVEIGQEEDNNKEEPMSDSVKHMYN